MKGKIITCCGDCIHYDWKKHKCKNGYNKEDSLQNKFYDDCNMFKDLEEHDNEIYNKAIDDFKKELFKNSERARPVGWLEYSEIVTCEKIYDIAEKLKVGNRNES